jgi:hypothetical protein
MELYDNLSSMSQTDLREFFGQMWDSIKNYINKICDFAREVVRKISSLAAKYFKVLTRAAIKIIVYNADPKLRYYYQHAKSLRIRKKYLKFILRDFVKREEKK